MNTVQNEKTNPYLNVNYEDCMENKEIYPKLASGTQHQSILLNHEVSCLLKGGYSDISNSARTTQHLVEDTFLHASFSTAREDIPMSVIRNDGSWVESVPTLKVNSDSVQSLVLPIELHKPAKVILVENYTSQDEQGNKLTSFGYYMLDEKNQFFAKVVCIVDHNQQSLIKPDNSVENLIIEARLVERMSFMYENMPDYFAFKYNHLFNVLSV